MLLFTPEGAGVIGLFLGWQKSRQQERKKILTQCMTGVDFDSQDPDLDFAARLSQLGPVQPHPTQSNSSTFNETHQAPSHPSSSQFQPSASAPSQSIFPNAKQNPAVLLLTARYRLAEEAEQEFANIGRRGSPGRQFLDVITIRQILVLRDERGVSDAEIERSLGLREGVVGWLGRRGVVGASEGGMMG